LSDEARVAYLQEKIHEARRNRLIAYAFPFVFGLPSGFLWGLMVGFLGLPFDFWERIVLIYGGVVFAIGFGLGSYYGHQKNELMEQLKRMAEFSSYNKSE